MRFPDAIPASGTLYVVSTPIGNLEDITLRALRTLREVRVIACEDTRHTATLCRHYDISTPRVSYHEHNKTHRGPELVERLRTGDSVALVSDAGTPGIADPGYLLVRLAREAGIPVVPVPGANAVSAALSAAGAPTDRFEFRGFLPRKSGRRDRWLDEIASGEHVVAVYETPHRLVDTLKALDKRLPESGVYLCRELTKVHEEFLAGRPADLLSHFEERAPRGEIVLLIDPRGIGILEPRR